MDLSVAEISIRLMAAAGLGTLIGFEREAASRDAGSRTVALVTVGSALFTIAGAYGFADIDSPNRDPARIAAQVATGVGFIGGGAILRNGTSVSGLTTAATVWLAAGVGVTVAAGGYVVASIATAVTLVVLVGLRIIKPLAWRVGQNRSGIELQYPRGTGTLAPVLETVKDFGGQLTDLAIDDDEVRTVSLQLRIPRRRLMSDLVALLADLPDVQAVRCADEPAAAASGGTTGSP